MVRKTQTSTIPIIYSITVLYDKWLHILYCKVYNFHRLFITLQNRDVLSLSPSTSTYKEIQTKSNTASCVVYNIVMELKYFCSQ